MDELILQDKYLMSFFTNPNNGLGYKEVKANTAYKMNANILNLTLLSTDFKIREEIKNDIVELGKYGHSERILKRKYLLPTPYKNNA